MRSRLLKILLALVGVLLVATSGVKIVKTRVEAAAKEKADPHTPEGLFEAGFDLFNGYENSIEKRTNGWDMMLRAAQAGYLPAKESVADFAAGFLDLNMEEDRRGFFKPNLPLALEYYRDLVKCGWTEPKVHLALLYSTGIGEPANESESPHALLMVAAARGNKQAMSLLSERYLYGHGETKNVLEAARWEYLASINSHLDSPWVDNTGAPRIQDTPQQDEMAKTLSLFYKTGKFRDPNATAKLRALFQQASKPFNLTELIAAAEASRE